MSSITIPASFFLLPILAFTVYWPCLKGLPIFDDNEVLPNAGRAGTVAEVLRRYRPLTQASFRLHWNWWIEASSEEEFSRRLLPYAHGFNVLLHAFTGIIVENIAKSLGMPHPLLIGALFVVHPFAVNGVAYITGRASVLSGFFGLAGVAAILAGYPYITPVLWGLAVLAKEDAVAFASLYIVLDNSPLRWGYPILLAWGVWRYRYWVWSWFQNTGDLVMSRIGLPVALPFWSNLYTILTETLARLPLWAVGLGQSPYHGSGFFPSLRAGMVSLIVCVVLVLCVFGGGQLAIMVPFLMLGPWLVYLLCPVPDQLLEYRNYSQVAGFALLIGGLLA